MIGRAGLLGPYAFPPSTRLGHLADESGRLLRWLWLGAVRTRFAPNLTGLILTFCPVPKQCSQTVLSLVILTSTNQPGLAVREVSTTGIQRQRTASHFTTLIPKFDFKRSTAAATSWVSSTSISRPIVPSASRRCPGSRCSAMTTPTSTRSRLNRKWF
jgi:hypothetical protein